MDFSKKYDNPNPEETANLLSKIYFCWLIPLFKYGYSNPLETKDLYNTTRKDQSKHLGNKLQQEWENEILKAQEGNRTPSLLRAIRLTFTKPLVILGILQVVQSIGCRLSLPTVLAQLINYFENRNLSTSWEGCMWATILLIIVLLQSILQHYCIFELNRLGMQCRIATSSLIYRKLLNLSKSSIAQTTAGQVINLLSNDVTRFDIVPSYFHALWIMPIQGFICTILMYNIIGMAALVAIAALLIQSVLLQGSLSRLKGRLRSKIAVHTDRRVQNMSEITSGIRVIKMYCWEKPFEKIITSVRNSEMNKIALSLYIWGFVFTIARLTEKFTILIAMVIYVYLGNVLSAHVVFSIVQYINVCHLYMAILFPLAVSTSSEAKVSIKRIQAFLLLDDTSATHKYKQQPQQIPAKECGTIKVRHVKASWTQGLVIDTLTNINLDIKQGLLYAVVGPVGSGKSSLLKLFLKELSINAGSIDTNGTVSYSSQEPWLFGSSVRNNILFGLPYIEEKYNLIVQICALQKDFELLPDGDHTLVGERGTSLSGGQRARINLARAVYKETDIYLLDDPLSSVDTHVGNHLFEECIVNYLKHKTRVLVTHQLQYLKHVDQIIIIKNGQIEKISTYTGLSNEDIKHLDLKTNDENINHDIERRQNSDQQTAHGLRKNAGTNNVANEREPNETQELMEKGDIRSSLYIDYFRSGNTICLLLFISLVMVGTQLFCNSIDLWLAHWTSAEEAYSSTILNVPILQPTHNVTAFTLQTMNTTNVPFEEKNILYDFYNRANYIYVYLLLLTIAAILIACRAMITYKICVNASRKLHSKMFRNVLRTPIHFFDTNPSGRILNRFSKDLGIVDEIVPRCLTDSTQLISIAIGTFLVVLIVTPWMVVPVLFLAIAFYLLQKVYITSAQNIRRIEGLTKSPVLSYVSATIDGLITIKVSKAQAHVAQEFDILQDQHTSSYFLFIASGEGFGFYLDMTTLAFVGVLIWYFLIIDNGKTSSANIGLVLTQTLALAGTMQYGVRQVTELSNYMVSVERIMQYTHLEEETPFESVATKKPHRDWPQFGKIIFKDLTLKYTSDKIPVLQHLNIEIDAFSKVGIVGRTGAGKSSLITALFRLAPFEGSITVDNIDIGEIGLRDLRSKISIIPQEPTLFTASVRYNLDPYEKYEDKCLWTVLEDVKMKEHIESLDQKISEGGSNFSVGQKQLICLARAILQNNKILVMDEATANIDHQTDQLIQATIRKKFKDCTVLTIAHRLNTIMDSDKVIVMDTGEVVESGHAYELLKNEQGHFSRMLREAGFSEENQLRKIAENHYNISFNTAAQNT